MFIYIYTYIYIFIYIYIYIYIFKELGNKNTFSCHPARATHGHVRFAKDEFHKQTPCQIEHIGLTCESHKRPRSIRFAKDVKRPKRPRLAAGRWRLTVVSRNFWQCAKDCFLAISLLKLTSLRDWQFDRCIFQSDLEIVSCIEVQIPRRWECEKDPLDCGGKIIRRKE